MFGAIAGGIASALAGGAMSKLFGGGQKAASGGFFFSSRRRHTSFDCDWNSDVCSSDLDRRPPPPAGPVRSAEPVHPQAAPRPERRREDGLRNGGPARGTRPPEARHRRRWRPFTRGRPSRSASRAREKRDSSAVRVGSRSRRRLVGRATRQQARGRQSGMTDAKPNDNDAEYLLPPEFRKSWVAIPKHSLYQILAFGFFLGAALSLLVVGWIQNVSWMRRAPILVFAFFGL